VLLADTSTRDTTDIPTGTGRYASSGSHGSTPFLRALRQANRGAGADVTQDSTSKGYDIDNVAQDVELDRDRSAVRADEHRYNNVHFALSEDGLQPSTTWRPMSASNDTNSAIMFRRRLGLVELAPRANSSRGVTNSGWVNNSCAGTSRPSAENVNLTSAAYHQRYATAGRAGDGVRLPCSSSEP
jgi:hypothetical protein